MPRRSSCLLVLALASSVALGASAALAADGPAKPASFQVGGARFFLGGTVEIAGIYRGSNTGSSVATSFGGIPYENTIQGNLSESRMSAQMSRLSLRVMDQFGPTAVEGYAEADLAGHTGADQFVNLNSHTFRLTQYWADVRRGPWEVLAGQAWGWATPGSRGLDTSSPFLTRNLDLALQVGLPWTRAAQFRTAYHAGEHLAAGVALENPQQFVGVGEVIYPFAFNAQLGTQADAANYPGAPNYLPDVLGKVAWDAGVGSYAFHLEALGLARWFRVAFIPLGGGTFDHHTTSGGGAGVTASIGAFDRLRLIASGFRGDGVGRYLGALGPDFVVRPDSSAKRISLSTVHAQSFLLGAELDLPGSNGLAAYYGRVDFDRNAFLDTTSPLARKPTIGFGGVNSPSSANRTLHEISLDVSHTFWSSAEHGSLALLGQFSEVFRQPWYAPSGAPNRALVDMVYLDVRYSLP